MRLLAKYRVNPAKASPGRFTVGSLMIRRKLPSPATNSSPNEVVCVS
jgi:hypothetical protein